MTQFRGLHNPDRHIPDMLGVISRCAECGDTGGLCHPDSLCRCCLVAEVETLRAQVQAVRDLCARREAEVAAQPFLSATLYVTAIWTALGVSEGPVSPPR